MFNLLAADVARDFIEFVGLQQVKVSVYLIVVKVLVVSFKSLHARVDTIEHNLLVSYQIVNSD